MRCSTIQHCPSTILLLLLFAYILRNVLQLAGKNNPVMRQLIHLTVLFEQLGQLLTFSSVLHYKVADCLFMFNCIVHLFALWLPS